MLKNNRMVHIACIFLLALALVSMGFILYHRALKNSLAQYRCATLEEMMWQQQHSFKTSIEERKAMLQALTIFFTDNITGESLNQWTVTSKLLEKVNENSGYSTLILADKKGRSISGSGIKLDGLFNKEYFKNSLAGQTCVSEPLTIDGAKKSVLAFSTPVYADGNVVAVLIGLYDANGLGSAFIPAIQDKGYSYVYNQDGQVVASTESGNMDLTGDALYLFQEGSVVRYDTLEEVWKKTAKGLSGHSVYKVNNEVWLIHYAPVGINDWFIFTSVSDKILAKEDQSIFQNTALLATGVIAVLAALLFMVVYKQRQYAKSLYQTAYYDAKTGVPNLEKFKLDAAELLFRHPNAYFYFVQLDIHQFKMINEMCGVEAGNAVIANVTSVLSQFQCDTFAFGRMSADTFVWMDMLTQPTDIQNRMQAFEKAFHMQDAPADNHKIEFHYGIYMAQREDAGIDAMLEKVNLAHGMARKQQGGNTCDYNDSLKIKLVQEKELENKMEAALANKEFVVYLQPKYHLETEMVVGAEALVRWQTDDRIVAYPNQFVPLFEQNGFIVKLDMYMLEQVCALIRSWMDAGKPLITVSLNFSRLFLTNEGFVEQMEAVVNRYQVPRQYFELEFTPSAVLNQEKWLQEVLHKLHDAGFILSLDNFGTGYSSLGLLKNLPVDAIKIDKAFFISNPYKTRSKTIVKNMTQMAKELGIRTAAEGVETDEHVHFLREVGCEIAQGYYFSRPVLAADFAIDEGAYMPLYRTHDELLEMPDIECLLDNREQLGHNMPVLVYRLFAFSLRKMLSEVYGEAEMHQVLRRAGSLAGRAFAHGFMDLTLPMGAFVQQMAEKLKEQKIGLLTVEHLDEERGSGVFVLQDDLDCSGMDDCGESLCQFDEGFIAGVMYAYTQKSYVVMEVACWGNGSSNCRFEVRPK